MVRCQGKCKRNGVHIDRSKCCKRLCIGDLRYRTPLEALRSTLLCRDSLVHILSASPLSTVIEGIFGDQISRSYPQIPPSVISRAFITYGLIENCGDVEFQVLKLFQRCVSFCIMVIITVKGKVKEENKLKKNTPK